MFQYIECHYSNVVMLSLIRPGVSKPSVSPDNVVAHVKGVKQSSIQIEKKKTLSVEANCSKKIRSFASLHFVPSHTHTQLRLD